MSKYKIVLINEVDSAQLFKARSYLLGDGGKHVVVMEDGSVDGLLLGMYSLREVAEEHVASLVAGDVEYRGPKPKSQAELAEELRELTKALEDGKYE